MKKTTTTILKSLIVLCATLATTAAFAQTNTDVWTGGLPATGGLGLDLDYATNWDRDVIPATTDILCWSNVVPGNLFLRYKQNEASGSGGNGYSIYLNSNQTGSVTIYSTNTTQFSTAFALGNFILIDPGAGAFTIGGTNGLSTTVGLLNIIGRNSGIVHQLYNNSTNVATLTPGIEWTAGGGSAYTLDFGGTGNWQANNYLNNNNSAGMLITEDGPGTLFWNPQGLIGNSGFNSPITINGGAIVLSGAHPQISGQTILNDGLFEFNATNQSQTLTGIILGTGNLQVNAGTLTLSSDASYYTGNTVLTNSGTNIGTIIVNGAEFPGASGPLGQTNTIVFGGGALQFSVNNTFDYSSRFSTAASQQYRINAGGQSVLFTTGLTSVGGSLTFSGPGTLTLAGTNSYTGTTTVNSGTLVFQGPNTGVAAITVADSAALVVTATNAQYAPTTLTLGTSAGATLGFNNIISTTTAPLAAGTLSAPGTLTVNINSGTFTVGQSYPLMTWTSGTAPTVVLGALNGFIGNLTFTGNKLVLNISGTAYRWTGLGNGQWDTTSANNWFQNGASALWANGSPALLDDTATGGTSLNLDATVTPSSITVNDTAATYSINSSTGSVIAGGGGLTKSGTNTLTLSGGANTFTGATTLNGGTVIVGTLANGGTASDLGAATRGASNLVFNGGTLQYSGFPVNIDHLFTLGTGGGTIVSAGGFTGGFGLAFTNTGAVAFSGTGARVLTLAGSDADTNVLAAAIGDNGGSTSLTLAGTAFWALTGTNTYSGVTTIEGGNSGATLQIGNGGASGSPGTANILDDAKLVFNRTNSLTVGGAVTGTGSVTVDGGTVVLAGNNTYQGGTTIQSGTLQIGSGGASGGFYDGAGTLDNGTLVFDSTTPLVYEAFASVVSGTGNLSVLAGNVQFGENNTYTGWTFINSGAIFQPTFGNQGGLVSPVITNNGTFFVTRQDGTPTVPVFIYAGNIVGSGKVVKDANNQNLGYAGISGTNTYTGGTFIGSGGLVLGDGITTNGGSIVGPVIFTNSVNPNNNPKILVFNRPDNFTFTNTITSVATDGGSAANRGSIEQSGFNTVTVTGNLSYPGTTTIDATSILQVGAGGSTGNLGSGGIAVSGALVFDLANNVTISNVISGVGTNIQIGTGTISLAASNTYSGPTIISNGTLALNYVFDGTNALDGDLDVYGGNLLVGASTPGAIVNEYVLGNLNITAGTITANLNKSLSPSNSTFSPLIAVNATGGTLRLLNFGPNVAVGDQFTIFNQPVSGGASMTIESPGFTVANNLATSGSVTVTSVSTPSTDVLTTTRTGGLLNVSWPTAYKGLVLQALTNNSPTNGYNKNGTWFSIPGTGASNAYSVTVGTNASVFFRLSPQ